MLEFLGRYGLFVTETLTLVVLALLALLLVVTLVRGARQAREHEQIELQDLGEQTRDTVDMLNQELLPQAEVKRRHKQIKREEKQRRKHGHGDRPRLFVLDFDGDIEASQTSSLRREISAIVQIARPQDEVLLRLESPGGVVHGYGLAASQLRRLRERGIRLTAAVDKVAASGGYMMACVADQIIAAPFAVVGSIGVVGQLPNFHRWLQSHEIDYELHTAGDYKRTLTLFGENTDAARAKFLAELEETHVLFKRFVGDNRSKVAIDAVATGEHWYGTQALEKGLVDRLLTSDDFILEALRDKDVYHLHCRVRRGLRERLLGEFGAARGWHDGLPTAMLPQSGSTNFAAALRNLTKTSRS